MNDSKLVIDESDFSYEDKKHAATGIGSFQNGTHCVPKLLSKTVTQCAAI